MAEAKKELQSFTNLSPQRNNKDTPSMSYYYVLLLPVNEWSL
jgi:hypothetical protein